MIKNYFKIILRNIQRYAAHTLINTCGMAIGIAGAILILLWVQDEWSYDRHFKNADNIFRVIEKQNFSNREISMLAATPSALARTLKEEYPEIIRSSRYADIQFPMQKGKEFIEARIAIVDKEFLTMFDIHFVQGKFKSSLTGTHDILITESLAKKYFSNEDPIGKKLTSGNGQWVFTVTGIVKNLPRNSHIQFDIIFPFEFLNKAWAPLNEWGFLCYNYIELGKGVESKIVDVKIKDFIRKHNNVSNSSIFLQNIKKIHLFSSGKFVYDISGHGDNTYVRIMGLIAIFILLIACINFMNLSTAQSARRSKEIGVRKVAGAKKQKIIFQFLGESFLIVFTAHIIAMILVELLLPGFNNLTDKHLQINYQSLGFYLGLITIVLVCGLLAGSYPAFYLSSLKPLDIMNGVINKRTGTGQFRKALVIFQFSISLLLIMSTLIVRDQLHYMQTKNLGFNRKNIGYFLFDTNPRDTQLETFKKELSKNPDIVSITRAGYNPFNIEGSRSGVSWAGKKVGEDVVFYALGADEDYAKTYQLKLKEGRYFSSGFSTDKNAVVINEQAANIMGFKNPIGEVLTMKNGSKYTIIGVVKDFNFKSLHARIDPLIIGMESCNTFYIRMKPDKIFSIVGFIKKTYKSFNNPNPLNFHFLDNDFDNLYRTEQRMGKIFGYFSFLAIIISCLGLIGLSMFMTERRTKEIGIRKTNGAKSIEILSFLSKEYVVLVLISFLIASPVAWYVMNKWLQNFAYRVAINWWILALACLIVMIITMLTVGFQAYIAARKHPVKALRYE